MRLSEIDIANSYRARVRVQILKGFQMDAMYENLFKESNNDDDVAAMMQGLLADFATADVVMASKHKHKKKQKTLRELFEDIDTDDGGTLVRH